MTALDIRPDERVETDEPEISHYCRKSDILRAYIEGTLVEALCGVLFVPTRDPERYPTCQECAGILRSLPDTHP